MSKHKAPTRGVRRRTPTTLRPLVPARTASRAEGASHAEVDSFQSPLARLLDAPHLSRLVPHLAPETLHALIRHSGLHACGDLVAAATPAQMLSVFDLDLWRHAQPGHDEQFDPDRFAEWLEVLVETGEAVAARIIATLDKQLVIAGLSRHIRVFDPSTIAPPGSADDDEGSGIDLPSRGVECELGGYRVCATGPDAWDAIVALLLALEADHHDCFHAVMRGCRSLSNSTPEVDGLDHLPMVPQQLLHEVAVEREHRRSQQGYSTSADARAFLQMARQRKRQPRDGAQAINPIAAAYFRAADRAVAAAPDAVSVPSRALEAASPDPSLGQALEAIVGVLAEAGMVPQRPRALLEDPRSEPSRLTHIRRLMQCVGDTDETAYFARGRELAFLTNTLMAGCSVQSRPFTAQEASDAAIAACNLGLEHWPARWPHADGRDAATTASAGGRLPDAFLVDHDLVTAFEVGWVVLHEDVSLFVAEHLIATLTQLRSVDAETRRELAAVRRELVKQRKAGTPWRARDSLAVLATLDMPAWASLVGLLDECPILPEALMATLERRTGSVSATSFAFISTTDQIGAVRAFMATLLDVLGP